jgi:hypothetical protein
MVLLPHLHSVICGRGSRSVIYQFAEHVQTYALARDLSELRDFAAEHLPDIAYKCGVGDGVTSSIYQFGLSRGSGEFIGYRHSCRTGFAPEVLEHGWGIMPVYDEKAWAALIGAAPVNLEDLVAFMVKTKEHDDSLPAGERAVIGGELQHLFMDATSMMVTTRHRFADFEDQFESAARNRARTES